MAEVPSTSAGVLIGRFALVHLFEELYGQDIAEDIESRLPVQAEHNPCQAGLAPQVRDCRLEHYLGRLSHGIAEYASADRG